MSESYKPQPLTPLDPTVDVTQNHYWSYHNIEALLSCKKPLTASQDEDLFIAVHQICELGFHQMILDLDRVLEAIATAFTDPQDPIIGDTREACYFFKRVFRLYEVVVMTMPILTTMRAFIEFRSTIGPTSGFQSFQFRQLEVMSGVAKSYWTGGTNDDEGKPHVAETEFDRRYGAEVAAWFERYHKHSLAFYYQTLLSRAPGESTAERIAYLQTHTQASALLKSMRSYEELQNRFHQAHLGLAVQQLEMVGVQIGTGGTSFRDYLVKYGKEVAPLFPGLTSKGASSLET
ncbi:tryptophan 2,3-dioxygenase family protein [Leptolyngbya sp. FACHB-261]|uniref:tryptophan 2,3-dioxygenase family protein n=1 Tax=Leptolyngbya sp. FACHB-261 TaxID=2692806 RepID=UPI001683181D|nr:tryptophan 2,3-dioxygenase family protein [Leptolyngbya sp. FACHB-261]MBD2104048.1 tryptophan 2,3-dioxygenase [Leptolyngbya sp. FACHB-261]